MIQISAEADFMIKKLVSYELFGQTFWLTTTHVAMLIVSVVLIIFAVAANRAIRHAKPVPGVFQNFLELIVEKLDSMVKNSMGKNAYRFVNYISSIFLFIPVSYTHLDVYKRQWCDRRRVHAVSEGSESSYG